MSSQMDELPSTEDCILELVGTRLRVIGDELQRTNKNDGIVFRLPLGAIQQVENRTRFDPASAIFAGAGCGLAALGYWIAQNNVLVSFLYVAAIISIVLAFFGSRSERIIIQSTCGSTEFQCSDPADEIEGFVISLRRILPRAK